MLQCSRGRRRLINKFPYVFVLISTPKSRTSCQFPDAPTRNLIKFPVARLVIMFIRPFSACSLSLSLDYRKPNQRLISLRVRIFHCFLQASRIYFHEIEFSPSNFRAQSFDFRATIDSEMRAEARIVSAHTKLNQITIICLRAVRSLPPDTKRLS
jgi:hypothetical protein